MIFLLVAHLGSLLVDQGLHRTFRSVLLLLNGKLIEELQFAHLDLFFHSLGSLVEQFIKNLIEKIGDTIVEVLRVQRILLHLGEPVSLENERCESVVGLLETVQVVLEHLVSCLQDLNLPEG